MILSKFNWLKRDPCNNSTQKTSHYGRNNSYTSLGRKDGGKVNRQQSSIV